MRESWQPCVPLPSSVQMFFHVCSTSVIRPDVFPRMFHFRHRSRCSSTYVPFPSSVQMFFPRMFHFRHRSRCFSTYVPLPSSVQMFFHVCSISVIGPDVFSTYVPLPSSVQTPDPFGTLLGRYIYAITYTDVLTFIIDSLIEFY